VLFPKLHIDSVKSNKTCHCDVRAYYKLLGFAEKELTIAVDTSKCVDRLFTA